MSLSKEELNLFELPLIVHERAFHTDFYLFGSDLYVVCLPEYELVHRDMINYGIAFLERHHVGRHHCIFIIESFTDVGREVRDWASDHDAQRFTLSDAIVLRDQGQRIIADFYMKQDKPHWPTAVFLSLQEAIHWTKSLVKV